jgi:hypothetical protein
MSLSRVIQVLKGGQGSGNFGHSGRAGERGGSGEGGSAGAETLKEKSLSWSKKITAEEKKYLDFYTQFGQYEVNGPLRDGEKLESDRQKKTAEVLDSLIERAGVQDPPWKVYRGIKVNSNRIEETLSKFEAGGVITLNGYQSTTTDQKLAKEYAGAYGQGLVFEITSKRGAPINGASTIPSENEVLLGHGGSYKIAGIDRKHKLGKRVKAVIRLEAL